MARLGAGTSAITARTSDLCMEMHGVAEASGQQEQDFSSSWVVPRCLANTLRVAHAPPQQIRAQRTHAGLVQYA